MAVYIPRKQRLNSDKAGKWGGLIVLSDNPNYGLEPDRIKLQMIEKLKHFNNKEDLLLFDGSLVYNIVCASLLGLRYDFFRCLIWKSEYCERLINMKDVKKVEKADYEPKDVPVRWAVNEAHCMDPGPDRYIFSKQTEVNIYDPENIKETVLSKTKEFEVGDRVIISGNTLMNAITIMCLIRRFRIVTIEITDHKRKNNPKYRDLFYTEEHLEELFRNDRETKE